MKGNFKFDGLLIVFFCLRSFAHPQTDAWLANNKLSHKVPGGFIWFSLACIWY